MDGQSRFRIEPVTGDIAEHHQQQEPEIGALALAFRLEGQNRAIGVIAGIRAMFVSEIGRQPHHVVGGKMLFAGSARAGSSHRHDQSPQSPERIRPQDV